MLLSGDVKKDRRKSHSNKIQILLLGNVNLQIYLLYETWGLVGSGTKDIFRHSHT